MSFLSNNCWCTTPIQPEQTNMRYHRLLNERANFSYKSQAFHPFRSDISTSGRRVKQSKRTTKWYLCGFLTWEGIYLNFFSWSFAFCDQHFLINITQLVRIIKQKKKYFWRNLLDFCVWKKKLQLFFEVRIRDFFMVSTDSWQKKSNSH